MKMRSQIVNFFLVANALFFAFPLSQAMAEGNISETEAYGIGVEAYQFFYPAIVMDITRRVATNWKPSERIGMGPVNQFHHMRAFPPADFKEVVRPNFDTLYSSAWLDLSHEPMIISVPDTEGRYYLLPMLDIWTDVFASPGKRTSGTGAKNFAVTPANWQGKLPKGVERIEAPTRYVWIIGRTQTNGPQDYEAVRKVQDGYRITPLSQWGKAAKSVKFVFNPAVDMKTPPAVQVDTLPAEKYFSYGAEIMKHNPPHLTDWSQIQRFQRIGIEPGKSFDFAKAPATVKAALTRATADGLKMMKAKLPTLARVTNGWQMNTDTMGVYGDAYLKRAIIAMVGLGANQPEDAIYPLAITDATGQALVGNESYILHFSKEELPPVNAFWSVTMYDEQGFAVANSLNRFALGDRDPVTYNPDGSLTLYLQSTSPGGDKEANWLPSPSKGKLGVTMRLYAPKPEALDGRWNPPALKRVEKTVGTEDDTKKKL